MDPSGPFYRARRAIFLSSLIANYMLHGIWKKLKGCSFVGSRFVAFYGFLWWLVLWWGGWRLKEHMGMQLPVLTQHNKWVLTLNAKFWVIEIKIWNQTSFGLSEWKNKAREMSYANRVWVMRFEWWVMNYGWCSIQTSPYHLKFIEITYFVDANQRYQPLFLKQLSMFALSLCYP